MSVSTAYKGAYILAALDLWLATFCAINGDGYFAFFMLLAGLMWVHGNQLKKRADGE